MTTLDVKKFIHVPLYVEAVQITFENMSAVAAWCGGELFLPEPDGEAAYIKVPVLRPLGYRQTVGFETDWVLKTKSGHKVFTEKAFIKSFVPVAAETKE